MEKNAALKILSSHKKEVIDMLDILFDQEYVVDAAIAEAKREGEARGKAEGEARGILNLMKNHKMTAEQAMEALSIPSEEYEKYKKLLAGGVETI